MMFSCIKKKGENGQINVDQQVKNKRKEMRESDKHRINTEGGDAYKTSNEDNKE